jgi:hypothetical protein
LIFDQFEEFITLFEEALRVAPDAQKQLQERQQNVLRILVGLMLDETLPVKCLFVFREDYLAKLNPLFQSCPELLNQFVRLMPPRVAEAEAIIRRPFVNAELKSKFLDRDRAEISAELARTVTHQLEQRSDAGFINLSELQIICSKLWNSKDPDKYFEGKDRDVQRVVEDYWAGVLDKLGDLYEPATVLLGHMVTASGTRNIISAPDLETREKDFNPAQIEATLVALENIKLVRREPRNKIYFFEIVSEFLVPWIQQKKAERLAELKAHELAIESQKKLEQAETRNRRLLVGAGVLGLLLLVAIFAVLYAFNQRRVARKALRDQSTAQAGLQIVKDQQDTLIRLLNELTSQDARVRLDAVNGLIALDREGLLSELLLPTIVAVTSTGPNQDVSKAASYFFDRLALLTAQGTTNELAASILQNAEKNSTLTDVNNLAPRVYIQVTSDSQRARATLIAGELRKNGFIVPGFQLVDSRHSPRGNQLRYYKSTEESQRVGDPNVERLLALINGKDSQKWTPYQLAQSTKVRSDHYELWFARDSSAPDGILKLVFTDQEHNPISPEKFRVSLRSKKGFILPSNDDDSIAVPPGTYVLKIRVPGYEVYGSEVVISAGEETTEPVRLRLP